MAGIQKLLPDPTFNGSEMYRQSQCVPIAVALSPSCDVFCRRATLASSYPQQDGCATRSEVKHSASGKTLRPSKMQTSSSFVA